MTPLRQQMQEVYNKVVELEAQAAIVEKVMGENERLREACKNLLEEAKITLGNCDEEEKSIILYKIELAEKALVGGA